ncbi:MAG: hypothetical protein ABJA84_00295 [Polaromonas sp.]
MSADDHAILIGISRYPELGEGGKSADLLGPGNDVDAVKAWLLDPKGGAFPDDSNIHVIKSSPATSAADARPTADELELALSGLDAIAQANKRAGNGLRVGRRLYLFMSGHGFSPGRQRGCLFTANAKERLTFNIHATGWLNWLQDAGYFREFVLWMDSCMNRMSFLQPRDPPLPLVNASEPPRASFVAFAAQRPLKAVEVPIMEDGGKMHGVFTWTLLEGLRGAAADANGRVTGRSLADWIRNAQAARITQRDRDDRDVAKEPEVVQEDAGLIFARGVSKPFYDIRASFPPSIGLGTARLWSGQPPRLAKSFPVSAAPEVLSLQPGLYLIDVPHAGLRQGFTVVSPMDLAIEEHGPPVTEVAEGAVFQLDIDPGDPTAEIFVIDSRFSLVDSNPARLSTPLPSGLFKIKTRIGDATKQRVILLDRDRPPIDPAAMVKTAATVMPIFGTAASHEYHAAGQAAAVNAANALGVAPDRAVIMVMARAFSGWNAPVPGTQPWQGVSIVDARGDTVLDLDQDGERQIGGDPYAFCAKAVDPGSYFLRQRLDDGHNIDQSLIVCKSWRLEVYVLRQVAPGEAAVDVRPRIAVMMRRLGDGPGSDFEDRVIENARVALASERCILNAELESLLMRKFENPMAGIIGGHLLLVERDRDPSRDLSLLDTVVRNLQSLVGAAHPDVAALALQCSDARLRRVGELIGPPMFQRSWKLLTQAARKRPTLIPAAMWERVQALAALPPFLVWATDEAVKSAARTDLARAIFSERVAQEPPVARAMANASMLTPAAAAAAARSAASRAVAETAVRRTGDLSRMARVRAAQLQVPPSAFEALKAEIK